MLHKLFVLVLLFVLVYAAVPPGTAQATTATFTNSTPGFVDASVDTRTVTVTTASIPAGETITDVNITVDFDKMDSQTCGVPFGDDFEFANEISFALESPIGTVVNLVIDQSPGPHTYNTAYNFPDPSPRVVVTFDDAAPTLVGTDAADVPVSGTFRPEQPLSAFNGELPHGTWTFTYGDDVGADYLCFYQFDLVISTEHEFAIPNVGLIQINASQAQPAYANPDGEIAKQDGEEIWLPHDFDSSGYDTYVVTDVVLVDGNVWIQVFLGSESFVWVPLADVTPLTGLPEAE